MDLDAALDVDSRKKRRNRTTQSCLNCHTSKRKCDRKRPCQRCIQLGLTGLCVYEVDDPAARDDPNVDEVTRLRNRIAELESLVRELRGKPHPRWVENGGFRGTADSERASRLNRAARFQASARHDHSHSQSDSGSDHAADATLSLPSVKAEPNGELAHPALYTIAANGYDTVPGEPPYFELQRQHRPSPRDSCQYSPISPGISTSYSGSPFTDDSASSYFPRSAGGAPLPYNSGANSAAQSPLIPLAAPGCAPGCQCVNNASAGPCLVTLAQHLQSTLGVLRQLPEHHAGDVHCALYKRISELQAALSGVGGRSPPSAASYDVITPSGANGSLPPSLSHTSGEYRLSHEWHNAAYHGYSVAATEHGVYNKNMPYSVAA